MASSSAAASLTSSNDPQICFLEWMKIQQTDLSELLQALSLHSGNDEDEDRCRRAIEKSVQNFQEYISKRSNLARGDIFPYFAPSWCTTLENSLQWIGGCRPSMYIRLLYALCGAEFERQLPNILLAGPREDRSTLGDLSARQLSLINTLHSKVIHEEEKLTSHWATLQEDIADQPLAVIATGLDQDNESSTEIDEILDEQGKAMAKILEKADEVRLTILKELLHILTPKQGVHFMAAGKKLHLQVHGWGKKRDELHGGSSLNLRIYNM